MSVTIIGNIVRDPEIRFSQSGLAFLPFSVAVNNRKNVNGTWEDNVSFFDVTAFGEQAENVAATVAKGDRVIVTGKLQQESWEDKETGAKRSKVAIVADEIGTSLRWATAQVAKTPRPENNNGSGRTAPARNEPTFDDAPF
jgi:single-strand DNA-binding protein